ncbi:MAG: AMP-binding protein [Candidatus Tectomicrobia bacterium]|uniref:AMP-binding protein n=1 Tax=Tectimicrobiota bacterium TaxID=2528274 RepID=A0A937VWW1_UNCTE|nr:AMP-binding protein [Candidatus Tectomicrobia bacterium]
MRLPGVPIGRPIANTQVYVLDTHMQPVPLGLPGELYVGGASLTHGYWGQPALTAARFLPNPFSDTPGTCLYKTGELVRYQPDGTLLYLGRLDHQIKWHGIRIELGEIEAALRQHPMVQDAVVLLHEAHSTTPQLVAYVVPGEAAEPTHRELRRFLTQRLPPTMVPTLFVMLTTLPLTPSGKIDRQHLPAPSLLARATPERYVAPRTPVEQQVVRLWEELLKCPQIGVHDDFFELGGHSLLAMHMLARVQDMAAGTVSLVQFFTTPTVAGIAEHLATGQAITQRAASDGPVALPRTGPMPASIAQAHFWFFAHLLPDLPFLPSLICSACEAFSMSEPCSTACRRWYNAMKACGPRLQAWRINYSR